jgi:hypothetical protein
MATAIYKVIVMDAEQEHIQVSVKIVSILMKKRRIK